MTSNDTAGADDEKNATEKQTEIKPTRSREPLGDISQTDLSDDEVNELARDIEAERDA